MVLNYIWIAFFVIAFLFGLVELCFMGNTEVFTNMVQATFDSSKTLLRPLWASRAYWPYGLAS